MNRTLLAAAAVLGASSTAKAYHLFGSSWDYSQPTYTYGSYNVANNYSGREYINLTNDRPRYYMFAGVNATERDLVNAAVYRGADGSFSWSGNTVSGSGAAAFAYGVFETGVTDNAGDYDGNGSDFDAEGEFLSNGTYTFDTTNWDTNLAIGHTSVGIYMELQGNNGTNSVSGGFTVYERTSQVARTGDGGEGAFAFSAFADDNSETLSGTYYGANFGARNVLPLASAYYDAEGATYGPDLAGSVVKLGDVALGFLESEGLYAKDGGWLDIRGDLTLGAGGTIYIRDGEITSNIYTQFYAPGTLTEAGSLAIESGILSVRNYFAQDMVAVDGQTLGFRDGAVNNTRLILSGLGYGVGEGFVFGDPSNGGGALRSITGNNVQNGNLSIVSFGPPIDGALIGIDGGATLTINGTINGLNNVDSDGGATVGFNAVGNATVNGRILAGINDVYKLGTGELLINSSNLFTGDVNIIAGSVRITNSGALSGTSGQTYAGPGASLVLDQASGLSLVDDIHIDGTGLVGVGGALHNKTGTNVTTGNLWIDDSTEEAGNAAATAKVDASSSLTVAGLRSNGTYNTFTIDVGGADLTSGSFTVSGNTGEIDDIVKNGTGLATFTTLSSNLQNIYVNAGKVVVLGSASTAIAPFDKTSFDKWGAAVIEIRGSHFYDDFDVREGTANLFGNVTGGMNDSGGDFDIGDGEGTSGILNVESGATLTHISEFDGDPNANTDGVDIVNNSALNVKRGGVVQLNGAEIDLDDTGTVSVAGTLSSTDAIYANDNSTVTVLAGGVVNTNIDADSTADVVINAADVVNEYARGQVTGNATISDSATLTVNGLLTGNVTVSDSGIVRGSGQVIGNLNQNNATIAPGNSPGILLVTGNYTNVGGQLDLELAGTGVAGTAYDQLRVTGTITVSNTLPVDYSVIRFIDVAFEAEHGDVFQVIANGSGNARNTFDKFDLSQTVTAANDRVLFNHATGKAYGTGLTTAQNFSNYARNRNQSQIGRALWMEAIDYDKSGISGELSAAFIATAYNPTAAGAKTGLKAWILTRHVDVIDPLNPRDLWVGENATDLGAAAVQMLTAASGAEGLDSLSPEAYSGFGEIAVRLNRNFAQLGATGRRSGDDNKWGFNLGYSGEQLTSDSTSAYTSHKSSSDTTYLTADLALGSKVHLNLSAGLDDGRVMARNFSGDTNSAVFGLGLSITPESKFARFDIGGSVSNTNFDAVRQGSYMSQDDQNAYAVAARVTFLPKEPSFNAVAKANQPAPSKLALIPYVGVSYASTDVDAFSEADVIGSAQLNVDAFKRRSLVGEFGLNAEYAVGADTTLTGVFAYEHEFRNGGRTDMNAEFADLGVDDTDFAIRTDGFGSSIFRLGIGIRQKLGTKASLGFGYDALLGSGVSSGQHIKADVSFRF